MLRKMLPTILLGIGVAFTAIDPAAADSSLTFCIGEFAANCSAAHDAWFGCGTDARTAAKNLCPINYPDGTTRQSPYRLIMKSDVAGTRCGYATFQVFCLDQSTK